MYVCVCGCDHNQMMLVLREKTAAGGRAARHWSKRQSGIFVRPHEEPCLHQRYCRCTRVFLSLFIVITLVSQKYTQMTIGWNENGLRPLPFPFPSPIPVSLSLSVFSLYFSSSLFLYAMYNVMCYKREDDFLMHTLFTLYLLVTRVQKPVSVSWIVLALCNRPVHQQQQLCVCAHLQKATTKVSLFSSSLSLSLRCLPAASHMCSHFRFRSVSAFSSSTHKSRHIKFNPSLTPLLLLLSTLCSPGDVWQHTHHVLPSSIDIRHPLYQQTDRRVRHSPVTTSTSHHRLTLIPSSLIWHTGQMLLTNHVRKSILLLFSSIILITTHAASPTATGKAIHWTLSCCNPVAVIVRNVLHDVVNFFSVRNPDPDFRQKVPNYFVLSCDHQDVAAAAAATVTGHKGPAKSGKEPRNCLVIH